MHDHTAPAQGFVDRAMMLLAARWFRAVLAVGITASVVLAVRLNPEVAPSAPASLDRAAEAPASADAVASDYQAY